MGTTPTPPSGDDVRFTVYDPFAEALYCRRSFAEAARDADRIGCTLILEMRSDDLLSAAGVRCRYRKEGEQWQPENPRAGSAARPQPAP